MISKDLAVPLPTPRKADFTQPIRITEFHGANVYARWAQETVGFGEFHISVNKDGSITADTECMGREWLRRALHAAVDALVDKAEIR